jgi:hypothetical protein
MGVSGLRIYSGMFRKPFLVLFFLSGRLWGAPLFIKKQEV